MVLEKIIESLKNCPCGQEHTMVTEVVAIGSETIEPIAAPSVWEEVAAQYDKTQYDELYKLKSPLYCR